MPHIVHLHDKGLFYTAQLTCKRWRAIIRSDEFELSLVPYGHKTITNEVLAEYPHCVSLALFDLRVMDVGLKFLTKLKSLALIYNGAITDDGIQHLTNLTDLVLVKSKTITDKGIKILSNLTKLSLHDDETITDDGIKDLTNLTELYLDNEIITDIGLKGLTNLTKLCLPEFGRIMDDRIQNLTYLTDLNVNRHEWLIDNRIKGLTNLTMLNVSHYFEITDNGIKDLTNLTYLNLESNGSITDEGLKNLTNLTDLNLKDNERITANGIQHLTKLCKLPFYVAEITGFLKEAEEAADLFDKQLFNICILINLPKMRFHPGNFYSDLRIRVKQNISDLCTKADAQISKKMPFYPINEDQVVATYRQTSLAQYNAAQTVDLESKPLYYLNALKYCYILLKDFPNFANEIDFSNYNISKHNLLSSLGEIDKQWNDF